MLLAVAGLDERTMSEKLTVLASDDWSTLPAGDKAAFAFARQMSTKPWELGPDDFRNLERHFGSARAVDAVWWVARCQYMTRVADSFQLPLERDNVFADRPKKSRSPAKPK